VAWDRQGDHIYGESMAVSPKPQDLTVASVGTDEPLLMIEVLVGN